SNFDAEVVESDDTRRCSLEVIDIVNKVFAPGETLGDTPFRSHGSSNPDVKPLGHEGMLFYPLVDYLQKGAEPESLVSEAEQVVNALLHMKATGQVQTFSQVLVLVRSHDSAQKLVPYLRRAGIEHQLKDNGERYTSMVWSDTQALFAWLDNTHDNFSLLQLLRSPLFGMTPGQFNGLVRFAGESNCSVAWEALQQLATSHDWARQAVSTLQGWLKCAYSLPLFELVSLVEQSTQASERYLNASNASQRLLFAEHWHWLKGWALQVNNGRFSSLTKAIEEAQVLAEHKGSDGEGALGHSDVLRVFTVHSAKGLEADHVWLFDATKEVGPRGISTDLLFDWPLGEDYPTSVTVHDKDSRESPARADIMHIENRARLSEDDHLLYVAITRARHQVHVSGTLDHHGHAKGWYERLLAHSPAQVEWPEQTDAQALAGAAQWVKPAFPVPQAMAMPVGEPMDKLDGPELRMGTAMHKVLEYVDHFPADGFETFWADRLLDCEDELLVLSEAETRQVKQVVEHLLEMDSLSPWLRSASEAWNELEWVGEAGQLLRADRVVKTPDAWWVLDYKWTVNNENFTHYEAQVQQYMRLLKTTLAANDPELPIKGALIDRQGRVRPVGWV
ncbi:MAG: 3'-5' exonuclease, partial [Limnobacter sp.]|nr:3'-5' exonuclease [Limnobacter sp.]